MAEDITINDILSELDKHFMCKLPGDITAIDVANRYGITTRAAHNRMKKLVARGLYEELSVYDPDVERSVTAYRRVLTVDTE